MVRQKACAVSVPASPCVAGVAAAVAIVGFFVVACVLVHFVAAPQTMYAAGMGNRHLVVLWKSTDPPGVAPIFALRGNVVDAWDKTNRHFMHAMRRTVPEDLKELFRKRWVWQVDSMWAFGAQCPLGFCLNGCDNVQRFTAEWSRLRPFYRTAMREALSEHHADSWNAHRATAHTTPVVFHLRCSDGPSNRHSMYFACTLQALDWAVRKGTRSRHSYNNQQPRARTVVRVMGCECQEQR